jgi:hypothetical protein
MKYKKKLAALKAAQAWFDKLPQKEKTCRTRPGSVSQKTGMISK